MLARALSGTLIGVEAHDVVVESYKGNGLPGVSLVGLARGAVRESLVRVRSAVQASGVTIPSHRVVVNLLPAELPKQDSALDLALAASLLVTAGAVPAEALVGRRFYGELSLGGRLEPVRGAILLADLARRRRDRELLLPRCNAAEAAIIPGVRVVGVDDLAQLIAHLRERPTLPYTVACTPKPSEERSCLSEIRGQEHAKRALEIAAAGGHNMLLVGPPGSGKTMLARCLPGLLPNLAADECIEVTRIYSAAGLLQGEGLVSMRPFRAPHHTASEPALCGGGGVPRPGEISLAHRGVLFLDELPEFSRRTLETLREPIEEGCVRIARASWSLSFPADVMLVAAMNPCPCGNYVGDRPRSSRPVSSGRRVPCLCTFDQVQRYRSRISGPLLDRIDLHILVEPLPYRAISQVAGGETSAAVRARVAAARRRQNERLGGSRTNAAMRETELRAAVTLDEAAARLIEHAVEWTGMSARAISRILKVARTIADLEGSASVDARHVDEAIQYRVLDRGTSADDEAA